MAIQMEAGELEKNRSKDYPIRLPEKLTNAKLPKNPRISTSLNKAEEIKNYGLGNAIVTEYRVTNSLFPGQRIGNLFSGRTGSKILLALEHARDPGADPALLVLANALEEEIAQRQCFGNPSRQVVARIREHHIH